LPVWPETVQGRRLVDMLQRHVARLREESPHGNRRLFLDDVFVAYLLAFYNPTVRSLRTIEDFSQTRQAQKSLSIRRVCKSTLSDFNSVADPQRLQPILDALRTELGRRALTQSPPRDLGGILKQVVAVDGTFLPALADVAWAVRSRNQREGERYRARLDWQIDVHTWLPELVVVPDPRQSEAAVAAQAVRPGVIYVYDRGYQSFELMAAHFTLLGPEAHAHADFVLRLREEGHSVTLLPVTERPLTDDDRAACVMADRLVQLPGLQRRHGVHAVLREVVVALPEGGPLRLLTTLVDVPAAVIALLYQLRWQIELFFRWLKCYANFNHLISHSKQGVLLNFYVVVIGVLLTYLQISGRPSKYLFALLGAVASGGATLEEILPILRERERQCALARAGAARRRAKKLAHAR
jgi:hypothetical protein